MKSTNQIRNTINKYTILASFVLMGFLGFVAPAYAETIVNGYIQSDTTWQKADGPFIVHRATVTASTTLTIEPGTVVKVKDYKSISVRGTLIATSTAPDPIYFTSFKDDSVGGDANGDGSATIPTAGDWGGIIVPRYYTGNVILDHVVVKYAGDTYKDAAVLNRGGGAITINNSVIASSTDHAVYQYVGTTTIASTTIDGTNMHGVQINRGHADINNVSVYNVGQKAFFVDGRYATLSGKNNSTDGFMGYIRLDSVVDFFSFTNTFLPYYVRGDLHASAGETVTIEPGAVFKFENEYNEVNVSGGGSIHASGTAAEPIYFTSLKDDSIAGDTNNDADISSPTPGDWGGVHIGGNYNGTINLDHVIVRYGGGDNNNAAVLHQGGGSISVTNSIMSSSTKYGVFHTSNAGTTTVASSTIRNVDEYAVRTSRGPVKVIDSVLTDFGSAAFLVSPETYVENNTVDGNIGYIDAAGSLYNDGVWEKSELTYVVDGDITVTSGSVLTIKPGVVVKFVNDHDGVVIDNGGTLQAQGSFEEPIYFTSYKDDSVGGDTNNDGTSTAPSIGDWDGTDIYPNSGGTIELANTSVRYANVGVYNRGGSVSIATSSIMDNYNGISSEVGQLTITNSNIEDNTNYGVYNSISSGIDATNNYWGDSSGPYHSTENPNGTGDEVSDGVDFDYWLTNPVQIYEPPYTLTASVEAGYSGDENPWVEPNKGQANYDVYTFKAVYSDETDTVPNSVDALIIDTASSTNNWSVNMSVDTSAASSLHDGDYTNGEQYVGTFTMPLGDYTVHIEAEIGSTTVSTQTGYSFSAGYDNVLFIPGIMGSNIKNVNGTCWPNIVTGSEYSCLEMTDTDTPNQSSVVTSEVIDSFGIEIYDSILTDLNSWQSEYGIVATSTPYDWRYDYEHTIHAGIETANGISYADEVSQGDLGYIEQKLRDLATTSRTGKVTVLTHSMGGLIAKTLLNDIGDSESSELVNRLILVASPQLGTPQAVGSILHGTNGSFGWFGSVLSEAEARGLSQNMQSTFNLLPSDEYFASLVVDGGGDAINPVITFASSTLYSSMVSNYGNQIDDWTNLEGYMKDGKWGAPSFGDTDTPEIAATSTLSRSEAVHDTLDTWTPSQDIEFITIAGWGVNTLTGIGYYDDNGSVAYNPHEVVDGDGTVVVPSALYSSGRSDVERYWVDLFDYKKNEEKDLGHKDIFAIDQLRTLIENRVANNYSTSLPQYISTSTLSSSTASSLEYNLH